MSEADQLALAASRYIRAGDFGAAWDALEDLAVLDLARAHAGADLWQRRYDAHQDQSQQLGFV